MGNGLGVNNIDGGVENIGVGNNVELKVRGDKTLVLNVHVGLHGVVQSFHSSHKPKFQVVG